jgi:hypothetical protein
LDPITSAFALGADLSGDVSYAAGLVEKRLICALLSARPSVMGPARAGAKKLITSARRSTANPPT